MLTGRGALARVDGLILRYGIGAKLFEWIDEITTDCWRKRAKNLNVISPAASWAREVVCGGAATGVGEGEGGTAAGGAAVASGRSSSAIARKILRR